MKLDKLALALYSLRSKFKVDSTDILIINAVLEMRKQQGDVLTMQFLKNFKGASQATTHARMKKLLQNGLLARVGDDENLRIKKLEPTAKTTELVKYLGEL
jgi:DNA-binding MarR family transcriptional regulator